MYRIILTIIVVLAVLCYSCSSSKNESEPNNSIENAQPIMIGSLIKGCIESDDDIDIYIMTVEEEKRVSLSISQLKGINHSITVLRDIGEKQVAVKKIDDSRKSSPEKMPLLGLIPGTYYFVISHGERDEKIGSSQKYTFIINELQDGVYEFEPNDIPRMATPIVSGTGILAFYSPSFNKLNKSANNKYREYDYFSLTVSNSEAGRFLADVSVSGVPGVDSVITMYSPAGKEINRSDSGVIGAGETIIGQGLSDPGTYLIEIYGKNFASNNETPYTLNLNIAEFDSSFEMELNNSIESANVLRGGSIKGRIFPEDDVDYFVYIPENPEFVDISLIPSPEINGRFVLYNSAGEKVFEIDNHEAGMTEQFPAFFSGEKFYIQVLAFAGEMDSERFYTLSVKPGSYQDSIELEPNDEKERATYIENGLMYGYSSYKNDKDFYMIETDGRKNKILRITGVNGANFEVSITDNLGYIINSYELNDDNILEITELIDKRAYVIIDTKEAVYDKPYIIEIIQ
ncbi:MAG: hypothetical protein PF637_10070 [Spirochaetes bacterium]|nr:hypothetical protein [Spirochaetota bacterium]